MVFICAVAERYGDHVAEITAILVYGYAVFLAGVVRIDDVVGVLAGA